MDKMRARHQLVGGFSHQKEPVRMLRLRRDTRISTDRGGGRGMGEVPFSSRSERRVLCMDEIRDRTKWNHWKPLWVLALGNRIMVQQFVHPHYGHRGAESEAEVGTTKVSRLSLWATPQKWQRNPFGVLSNQPQGYQQNDTHMLQVHRLPPVLEESDQKYVDACFGLRDAGKSCKHIKCQRGHFPDTECPLFFGGIGLFASCGPRERERERPL